ncbi:ATP-dependent helicase [Staphylococcus simiae]|uniref:UvrD-helicase domain-containing protein n=1 Tax=Staphylococcus simiae TaxID=308354 RepID=UPI001A975052|nr:ATP-dependent helicase [Staphylococcus simiae]MBO1198388.1 ATP-dependent helicase [Staphylococcus simiae]MBO1200582.1 ATP-dependent helicase [Staphylococcus simiae]MBO1202853.1 ATP-dependent helicase [Staphylococcus simiae]MBO1210380.1 ATP-dependent helicase [Staphylococcus simiae]MBO1228919.1 ATP-dependent helicase [Staphylococcus simiae]
MSKVIKATEEQLEIIKEIGNLVVTAKPGSGKTHTIIEKIIDISTNLLSFQGVIAISFTRKASQELESRYKNRKRENKSHFFGTIDKFYISEIIIPFAKILCGKGKPLEIKNSIDDYPEYKQLKNLKENNVDNKTFKILKKSLQDGLIFLEICGETALYILKEVPQSLRYLKARYTHIFIDEYQDCGKVQHNVFLELVNNGIKGIAVGDLDQAIYAFSGRYSKYLLSLIKMSNFKHLEITRNHRCHDSISNYSLELMGIKREKNIQEKRVFKVNVSGTDENIIHSIEKNLEKLKKKYNLHKNSDFAILCKTNNSAKRAANFLTINNKLFIETALDNLSGSWASLYNDILSSYYLYKENSITVLDFVSRYINEELNYKSFQKGLKIIDKIFKLNEKDLMSNIEEFYNIAQLIYPDKPDQQIFEKLEEVISNEKSLHSFKPASENEINIMTLHKSKGLEFKCVFLFDLYEWIFPPKRDWISKEEYIQFLNLHYVGITRAIDACYIMIGTLRYRQKQKDFITAKESPFLYENNTPNLRINLNW